MAPRIWGMYLPISSHLPEPIRSGLSLLPQSATKRSTKRIILNMAFGLELPALRRACSSMACVAVPKSQAFVNAGTGGQV